MRLIFATLTVIAAVAAAPAQAASPVRKATSAERAALIKADPLKSPVRAVYMHRSQRGWAVVCHRDAVGEEPSVMRKRGGRWRYFSGGTAGADPDWPKAARQLYRAC